MYMTQMVNASVQSEFDDLEKANDLNKPATAVNLYSRNLKLSKMLVPSNMTSYNFNKIVI